MTTQVVTGMARTEKPGFFQVMVAKYKMRQRFKRTMAALQELSDHELRDIGIHRSEIRQVAMEEALR